MLNKSLETIFNRHFTVFTHRFKKNSWYSINLNYKISLAGQLHNQRSRHKGINFKQNITLQHIKFDIIFGKTWGKFEKSLFINKVVPYLTFQSFTRSMNGKYVDNKPLCVSVLNGPVIILSMASCNGTRFALNILP